jgi:hypothetical protein
MGMLLRITQPGVDVPSVTSYLPTLGKNSSMLDVLVANEVELQYKATVYANVTDVMANPARTNERYSTKDAANCDGEGYISQRRRPNLLATNYPAWKDPLTPKDLFFRLFPILPPSVRPILKLENEETTLTSDLNTFYHFMMKHASRLRDFVPNHRTVPRDIFREELFLVQRFIDVTYDNGTKHFMKHVLYPQDRPFKSLADLLKKKEGFFRKHLLGKRVDYSGRSVITVGPHLKLHECGIPFSIALELFLPFLTNFLVSIKWVKGLFEAKKYLEKAPQIIIWFLLGKKINGHPVLLNRAPTLHKLGIQAFFPVLHGGKAIELHPLVCGGFNADFDGDQMGVHLPICRQAQMEARVLCLSSENWLSPANGQLNLIPSQDMVLGFYLLTSQSSSQFAPFFFKNVKTILQEHAKNRLPFHQSLWFRWNKAWKTNYKPATLIQRKPYLVRYINNTQVDVMEKMRGNYFVTWHKLRRWGPTHPSRKQHRKEHPVDSTNVVQCDGKDLHDDAKQRDDVELRVASHHASRRSEHRNSRTQPTRRQQQHIPSCIDELGAVVDAELSQYSGVAMLPSWMQNNRSTDGYEMSRLSRHRNIHPTNATVRQGCTSLRKILRNQVTDIGGKDYTPQSDAKATSHYAKQRALVPHDCSVSGSHRRSDLTQYRATQPHHSIQLNDAPVTIDPNMDPDTDPDWFERHRTHMVRLSSCDDAKQRLGPDAEQPRWFPIVRSTQRLVQRNTDVETGYWRRDSEPISTSEVQDCASKTQHTLDAKNANVAVGFDDAAALQRLTDRATTKAPDPTSHTPVPVTQYEVKVATLQSIDVRNNNGIEATGLGWGRCEATTNEHRRTNIAIELKLKLNHRYWIKRIFEKRKSSTNITAYGRPKRSVLANWYVGTLVDSLGTFGRVDVAQWEGRVGEPILTNRLPIAHNGTVPIKHRMGTSCLSMGRCVGNLLRLNSKDVDGKDYITHRRPQQVRRELRVASHHASTQHCNLTQVRNNQCYSDDAKQQLGSADATLPYTDAAYAANLATTDGPTNGEPNCDDAKHPRSRQRPRNTNYHIAGAKQFQSRSLQSRTSLRLQPDDPPLDELYPSTGLTYVVAHFINLDRKRNTIFFKTFQSFYPSFTTTRYAKIKTQYLLTTPGRILFQTYLF